MTFKAYRKNIYITNQRVDHLLSTSRNASRLIEEAIIFYDYAYTMGYLYDREFRRVDVQHLMDMAQLRINEKGRGVRE